MRFPSKALLSLGAALLPAAGCDDASPAGSFTVVDSAGIRVVTHAGEAPAVLELAGPPEWVVADNEAVGISLYDVVGAVLTADGGLVVGNAGNHEVLRLSPDDGLLWRVGREGDGPEEFRSITWVQGGEDGTVTLWDGRARRASALDARGGFLWMRGFPGQLETEGLPPEAIYTPSPLALTAYGDGALVGYAGAVAILRGRRGPLPLEADFRVYPAAADDDASEGMTLGTRMVISWFEDPSRDGNPIANALGSPRMWWSGHSGRLAYTSSVRPEIEVFDRGSPTLVIREDRRRTLFQPDSIPAGYDLAVDSLPAYEDLVVDALHRIWARVTRDQDPATWRLWDNTGLWLTDALLPPDARVMDARDGRLVLRRTDDLDIERLEVHRFEVP